MLQIDRTNTIILDRISISYDPDILQSLHTPYHLILNILRERAGHSSHIHLICKFALRLYKNLMSRLIRKLHNLILDRRTVSWSCTLNHTGKQWRTVDIITNDLMCLLICITKPAGYLIPLDIFFCICKGERNNMLISLLFFHLGKINRSFIQSCRCTCLKPTDTDSCFFHGIRQMIGCHKSIWSCMIYDISIDTSCFQISTCTENNCLCIIGCTGKCLNTLNHAIFYHQLCYFCLT